MKKTITITLLLLSVFAVILSGCTKPTGTSTVVDKLHEPEEAWERWVPFMIGDQLYAQWKYYHDDEDWIFLVKDGNGKTIRVYVTQEEYDKTNVGDIYFISNSSDLDDKDSDTKDINGIAPR